MRALCRGAAPAEVEAVSGTLDDLDRWAPALRDCCGIFHLAAHIPADFTDSASASECFRLNSLATLRIAAAGGSTRFVYFSAGNAYAPLDRPATEDDALYPSRKACYYLSSKVQGEIFLEHLRNSAGADAISLRVTSPYGPTARKSVVSEFLRRARAGEEIEVRDTLSNFDFLWASDAAQAAVDAFERAPGGVYNIGSGERRTLLDLARCALAVFGRSTNQIKISEAPNLVPSGFTSVSIAKAAATWGYAPLGLEAGLRQMKEGTK